MMINDWSRNYDCLTFACTIFENMTRLRAFIATSSGNVGLAMALTAQSIAFGRRNAIWIAVAFRAIAAIGVRYAEVAAAATITQIARVSRSAYARNPIRLERAASGKVLARLRTRTRLTADDVVRVTIEAFGTAITFRTAAIVTARLQTIREYNLFEIHMQYISARAECLPCSAQFLGRMCHFGHCNRTAPPVQYIVPECILPFRLW